MSVSKLPQRFSLDMPATRPKAQTPEPLYPRALSRPQGRGRDYRPTVTFTPLPLPVPATRQILPPEPDEIRPLVRRQGLLSGLFASLFRGVTPAAKTLRLAETVALGEKRFVAIIHAEGHKYLIGGSSSGVALLTQLDESAALTSGFQSLKGAIEAAG